MAVDDGEALVEVSDDGRGGVDPALGTGLSGLADRVSALGGTLEIESEAGEGSTIRARMPLGPRVRPLRGGQELASLEAVGPEGL